MKTLITIILVTLLTACGDGAYCEPEQVVKQEKPVVVVNVQQSETVEAPKPVEPVEPSPTSVAYCPETTGCESSPTVEPVRTKV